MMNNSYYNHVDGDMVDDMGCVIFHGTLVHSTEEEPLLILEDHILGIRDQKILFVEPSDRLKELQLKHDIIGSRTRVLTDGQFLMPGFVDTHTHAPQYAFAGTGLDKHLLEWLNTYTYPVEARFKDIAFAHSVYLKAVKRYLYNGTTTASYFATIHLEATNILCDVIESLGQRAYIGKVNMDQESPSFYVEDTERSLEDTETFIQHVRARKNPLLTPVVTPRFAIACSEKLMIGLSELARKYDLPIQSHVSENLPECNLVKSMYPDSDHYTSVYRDMGLLTDKTYLAHGVHLNDDEMDLIKNTNAGVCHCPNSNTAICSGMMDVRKLLDRGINVGIGTDVAGGYSPSMLDATRFAITVSKLVSLDKGSEYKPLSYKEAFRLATLGSARVLGLDKTIGNFVVGKDFDALVIDTAHPSGPIDVFSYDTVEDKIQKFLFLGDDRSIREIYVAGRRVK